MKNHKIILLFVLFTGLVLFISQLSKNILYVDKLYYDSLLEQMSYEKIQDVSSQAKKWSWVSYAYYWTYSIKNDLKTGKVFLTCLLPNKSKLA